MWRTAPGSVHLGAALRTVAIGLLVTAVVTISHESSHPAEHLPTTVATSSAQQSTPEPGVRQRLHEMFPQLLTPPWKAAHEARSPSGS